VSARGAAPDDDAVVVGEADGAVVGAGVTGIDGTAVVLVVDVVWAATGAATPTDAPSTRAAEIPRLRSG
jgi:hypothetical protein